MNSTHTLRVFRMASLIAIISGSILSIHYMLGITDEDISLSALTVLVAWVLAPYIFLWGVQFANRSWTITNRNAWYIVSVVVPLGAVLFYSGYIVFPGFSISSAFIFTPMFSLMISGLAILFLRKRMI